MIAKSDWHNVRIWIHSLANVQLVLYADEFKELLDVGVFRNMVIWNDAHKFYGLLRDEIVERLRLTLPEEDR